MHKQAKEEGDGGSREGYRKKEKEEEEEEIEIINYR